ESSKVLYEAAINIAHIVNAGTFNNLLFEIMNDQFLERNIQVFDKGEEWFAGSQNTKGKLFLEHLSSAIWYADPYIKLLKSYSYDMPTLFLQLPVYKSNSIYNTFYFKSHHKKERLSYQKLLEHCKSISIEYSVSEIWANKEYWAQIIPESSQLTNNSHNSTELVHMPSKNCSLTTILGSLNINSNYEELQKNLATKENYLGNLNYVWRISESNSNNNEHETHNARSN
ncbi:42512_t:CDS:2, partial [Gigaspora margarita]